jgi:hypothetical protein
VRFEHAQLLDQKHGVFQKLIHGREVALRGAWILRREVNLLRDLVLSRRLVVIRLRMISLNYAITWFFLVDRLRGRLHLVNWH